MTDSRFAKLADLLINYARIPASWIPAAEWAAEMERWGGSLILNTMICQPTGVTTLLGEISQLGLTLWWDEIGQKIRLRVNRPNEETAGEISDRNSIIAMTRKDEDNQRATQVAFRSVQIDPTKGLNKDNFLRTYISIYVDGESPNFYGESRIKTIYSRWLNQGDDAAAKIVTGRLLNRFKRAPVNYEITVDEKDSLELLDVVRLNTYASTDETGNPRSTLCQVFYRAEDKAGSTVKLKLQAFQFDAEYGRITNNARPVYSASTDAQKDAGTYFVGSSLMFGDGRSAYKFV